MLATDILIDFSVYAVAFVAKCINEHVQSHKEKKLMIYHNNGACYVVLM